MKQWIWWLSGLIIIVIPITVLFIWWSPVSGEYQLQKFTVNRGDTVTAIAGRLEQDGLIRSPFGFKLYLKLTGKIIIQPGVYQLSPTYTAIQTANVIANGDMANISITIPEGYTVKQIATLLSEKNIISEQEFLIAVDNFPPDYDFLKSKPSGKSLEGFLFPDTYRFIKGDTTGTIRQMLDNFSTKYQSDIKNNLNNKNLYEVLIVASLIEKEAKTQTDREQIAAVIYNRLKKGMRLDIDATVRYITGNWKNPITQKDLNNPSPYNTRQVAGLPPTPICNPGLSSIKAAINPPSSDYYYYLTDSEGVTHYAKTLAEHNANKLKYLL